MCATLAISVFHPFSIRGYARAWLFHLFFCTCSRWVIRHDSGHGFNGDRFFPRDAVTGQQILEAGVLLAQPSQFFSRLVRCEHVLAQGEAGMEKGLIILAGGVEILDQTEHRPAAEVGKLAFEVAPGRLLLASCH
ncbi:MAG: hypothetical protein WBN68_15180 [Sedimenticolaceae bacterium]